MKNESEISFLLRKHRFSPSASLRLCVKLFSKEICEMATKTEKVKEIHKGNGSHVMREATLVVEEAMARAATPAGVMSCREAAEKAIETFATDEFEKHAQVIAEAWLTKLNQQEKVYAKMVKELAREAELEVTGPITPAGFRWWSLLLAGPFQATEGGGPYQPCKTIKAGEEAFFLAVLRRNQDMVGGIPASVLMSPYEYTLRLRTVNLNTVSSAPLFGPITANFGPGIFGFLNYHIIPISTPPPVEGDPTLYETHMVVDIDNPGLPFAGFSDWVLDPDTVPPVSSSTDFSIWSSAFGGPYYIPQLPGITGPHMKDAPARWMVYAG
jgi:hypothetical protein